MLLTSDNFLLYSSRICVTWPKNFSIKHFLIILIAPRVSIYDFSNEFTSSILLFLFMRFFSVQLSLYGVRKKLVISYHD